VNGIPFPDLDPVALRLGPLAIRWYALAYIAGIVAGWRIVLRVALRPPVVCRRVDVDDFVAWITIGVIAGGRLGHVLFYEPARYLADPLEILMVWRGGMAFHGGVIGAIAAIALFARRRRIAFLPLADLIALVTPIGVFFGRIANFVNGELWGKPSGAAWAMVFPRDPTRLARHPSQLYEAALEGLLLFALLAWLAFATDSRRRPGTIGGAFLAGYGVARALAEIFREPDGVFLGISAGQWYSLPMVAVGLWLVARARRGPRFDGLPAAT
jgi:phosphatidylglycerol:prolipoprotein diacylglycerol transferase